MLQMHLEHSLVAITGLALLFYLGFGPVMWLPASLAPYRWLIAPWAGFALLTIATQFLSNAPFSVTGLQSGFITVALATIANAASFRRFAKTRRDTDSTAGIPYRWLALISAGVFVLSVLPVWSYGFPNVIGENWDSEMYLALGEYLKSYSQSNMGAAPPNPTLFTLLAPPVSERTQAFSYFQAALGFLPLDSLQTLVPGLALIRALSVPAVYVLFATWLRLPPRIALLASAVFGLNAFLLWITYNSFAMQVPSFGLLPLALAATLVAVNTGSDVQSKGREQALAVVWMGFFLGALAVSYHPALTAYFALAGPPVLVTMWLLVKERKPGIAGRVAMSVAIGGVIGFALSLVSQLMSLGGFLAQYGERSGGLGLETFTAPSDAFGFSLSFRPLLPTDPGRQIMSLVAGLYALAGWLALTLALAVIGFYLYRLGRERKSGENATWTWQVWAVVAGAVTYALLFLVVLNYPYAWFKALSFAAPVLVGVTVAGFERLLRVDRLRRVTQLAGGGLLVLVLTTTVLTVGLYWAYPTRFSREMVEAGRMRSVVNASPPGERGVYIAESPGMQNLGRLSNGLLSYFLRDANLYGNYWSAYSRLDRRRPEGVYDFVVLRTGESPAEYGMGNGTLAWQNSLLSLYNLPREGRRDLYHKNYRDDGSYPHVDAGQPVTFNVEAGMLQVADEASGSASFVSNLQSSARQVTLGFAAPSTSTLLLQTQNPSSTKQEATITIPPGYSTYRTGQVMAPSVMSLELSPSGGTSGDAYVRWAHLESAEASNPRSGLSSDGDGLLLWLSSEQTGTSQPGGNTARISLDYMNALPGGVTQTLSLDIYGKDGSHFGYWNLDVPESGSLSSVLDFNLVEKSLTFTSGPANLSSQFRGDTSDGEYVASLLLYVNGKVYETFNDIFTFTIENGEVSAFEPRKLPPIFR